MICRKYFFLLPLLLLINVAFAQESSVFFIKRDLALRETRSPKWLPIATLLWNTQFWIMDTSAVYLTTHHLGAAATTLFFSMANSAAQSSVSSGLVLSAYDRYRSYPELQLLAESTGADRIHLISSKDRWYHNFLAAGQRSHSLYLVQVNQANANELRRRSDEWIEVDPAKSKIRLALKLEGQERGFRDADIGLDSVIHGAFLSNDILNEWKAGVNEWSRGLATWNRHLWLNTFDDMRITASLVQDGQETPIGTIMSGSEVPNFLNLSPKSRIIQAIKSGWSAMTGGKPKRLTSKTISAKSIDVASPEKCMSLFSRLKQRLFQKTVSRSAVPSMTP